GVRALLRPGGRPCPVYGVPVSAVDLGDRAGLAEALRGCAAVVHAAARMEGDPRELEAANVDGTRNVVEACRRVGVRRLVLLSTVAVYGDGDLVDVDESRTPDPRGAYGIGKLTAERI